MKPHGRPIKKFLIRKWRMGGKPAAGAELDVLKAIRASKPVRGLERALVKNVNSGVLTKEEAFRLMIEIINKTKKQFLSKPENFAFAGKLEYLSGVMKKFPSAEEKQEYKKALKQIIKFPEGDLIFAVGISKDKEIEIIIRDDKVRVKISENKSPNF